MNVRISHGTVKIICTIVSCLCYLNSLGGEFCFDDFSAIVDNQDLRPETPWINLFKNDFWGTPMDVDGSHRSYRPLCIFTFRINYLIHDLDPMGYHAVNIFLHCVVCYMYTSFVLMLSCGDTNLSLISGLLFAIHPIHTEAIAGLVGRAETLSSAFFLLALFMYSQASKQRGFIYCFDMVIFLCSVVCSVLSKEVGITVIAVCCVYDAIYIERIIVSDFLLPTSPQNWFKKYKSLLKRIIVLIIFTITLLILRIKLNGPGLPSFTTLDNPAAISPSPTRQLTFLYLCFINSWLLIFPSFLCPDWTMQTIPLVATLSDPRNVLTIITFFAYFVFGIWSISNNTYEKRLVLVSLALIIFPFIPASNLFFHVGFVVAERILYIPSMGMCLIVAVGAVKLINYRNVIKYMCLLFLGMSCTLYCIKTLARNLDWHEDGTLFTSAIRINQNNAKLYNNLGHVFERREQFKEAEDLFRTASILQPDDPGSWINLGRMLKLDEKFNESEIALQNAIKLLPNITGKGQSFRVAPNHLHAYFNYANLLSQDPTRYQEAEHYYKIALRVRPEMSEAHMNCGNLLIKIGDFDRALWHFQMAIEKKPDYADAYFNLATTFLRKKEFLNAERYLRKSLSIDPNHIHSLINLATLLTEQASGKKDARSESVTLFQKVLEIDPRNEPALFNIGLYYADENMHQEAEKMFLETISINPTHKSALFNLGIYSLNFQRYGECIEYLTRLTEAYPNYIRAQHNLGDCYMHSNDRQNAKLRYQAAVEMDPVYVPSLFNLGVVFSQEKKFGDSIPLFEKVLALNPLHENAKLFLERSLTAFSKP